MFEHFSDKAVKAIMFAQEEARRTGHNVVGTEHLLLGVIGEETSIAATVLRDLGINLPQTRRTIENITGRGPGYSPANIPFTPKVKRIFEAAFQEARQLGNRVISPVHLLLAISSDQESLAAKVLTQQGVDLKVLRTELINRNAQMAAASVTPTDEPNRFAMGNSRSFSLAEFGSNLTQLAAEGKIDPVVGRHREVERTIQILGRRTKNNPVLVGEPGVGKTAIAEGLAQRIVSREVPELLQDKQVFSLDLGLLLAGTRFRGEFEERLKSIVEEVRAAKNIILVIDEIHTLVGAGALGGSLDAANMIKPALARGELQCLGTTTLNEYRQYIEKDAALERRFQPVMVGEPTVEETIEILQGLRKSYEDFHKVKFSDEALVAAAKLSDRYISDRFLPDKAIDLIDEAGSRMRVQYSHNKKTHPEKQLEESTIINPDSLVPVVDEEEIAEIVSSWTGVPVNKVSETESESLIYLEARLHERIIGQDEAVKAVSRAVRRARVGMKDPNRPIASFIFAGPTGVGKTELAKALATFLFGSADAMIRLDMSEFMEPHTVSKLIGSPPGYIGYDEGGQLTEAVRRKPYTVILFDEIEKAHPDVFNTLLQLLDDGRLTDAKGRTVDFKNTLIIMTSNVGSKVIEKGGGGLGFAISDDVSESQYNYIRNLVTEELKNYFRPEFLNRLDEIIVFRQLTRNEVKEIADILLQEIAIQLKEQREIVLDVTEGFKELVVKEGYDPSYGARPLRRAIMRRLEDSLAEAILAGQVHDGDSIIVDVNEQGQVQVLSAQQAVLRLQPVG
ncbi:ATP-dependent Clp protease ATP-binding subunit [Gloeothece verrucosa]|uniref:ATPase AAA-2 domain protein n=1 Tax=Gloeothece verrucosa (strain PCC 7822) TaxID=497965 RepID=E0UDX5_GLOV7|nr:ATP-dependent Clp protease ATP-binding subunit [Gloeothece verrucosa]ADN12979.1 ATPase AAA-2 domain protein [Gloeothece verrucosa PCC 7822]